MKNNLKAMAGGGGCFLITDTTQVTRDFVNAEVMTDCVIDIITDANGRVKAAYNFGSSTLIAGTIITCQADFFTSIKLTNGSVMIYFK